MAIPIFLRIIGPKIIVMTIFTRSAGINGNTQIESAADTVFPDWKQNHAVPKA